MTAPDTYRELLELAAKAAGYKFHENDGQLWVYYDGTGFRIWNPFDDDGDALRLAFKLDIMIEPWSPERTVIAYLDEKHKTPDGVLSPCEYYGDDPMAACRRAIVRAAAEIGRAMP